MDRRLKLAFFLLWAIPLFAAQKKVELSAKNLESHYEEKKVILQDEVKIQHPDFQILTDIAEYQWDTKELTIDHSLVFEDKKNSKKVYADSMNYISKEAKFFVSKKNALKIDDPEHQEHLSTNQLIWKDYSQDGEEPLIQYQFLDYLSIDTKSYSAESRGGVFDEKKQELQFRDETSFILKKSQDIIETNSPKYTREPENVIFTQPMHLYQKNPKEVKTLQANAGEYNPSTRFANLYGEVSYQEQDLKIQSDQMESRYRKDLRDVFKENIENPETQAETGLGEESAQENVVLASEKKNASEQNKNLFIPEDYLTPSFGEEETEETKESEDEEVWYEFKNNLNFEKSDLRGHSNAMYYQEEKTEYKMIGDVFFENVEDNFFLTSKSAEGNLSEKNITHFYDSVVFTQEERVIEGNYALYNDDTRTFYISGAARYTKKGESLEYRAQQILYNRSNGKISFIGQVRKNTIPVVQAPAPTPAPAKEDAPGQAPGQEQGKEQE